MRRSRHRIFIDTERRREIARNAMNAVAPGCGDDDADAMEPRHGGKVRRQAGDVIGAIEHREIVLRRQNGGRNLAERFGEPGRRCAWRRAVER
jgi:hypothetical protein